MKAKVLLIIAVIGFVMLFTSCGSSEPCPAYGDYSRYQVDRTK